MRPQSIPNPHAIYFQQIQLQSVDPFSETAKKTGTNAVRPIYCFFCNKKVVFVFEKKTTNHNKDIHVFGITYPVWQCGINGEPKMFDND